MEQMTKVADIIQNLEEMGDFPSFDLDDPENWKRVIRYKLADPQTPSIIRAIQEDGFKVPIYLETDNGPERWRMGNGHHRLSIAILLGLDEVLTTDDWNGTGWFSEFDDSDIPREDHEGARLLSDAVDSAIDWDSWPRF